MQRGFTLIEILLVIAFFGFFTAATITAFNSMLQTQALTRGVNDVASIIEDARVRTLAGEQDMQFGVVVGSTTVTQVRGPSYDVSSSTSVVFSLPNNVEASGATNALPALIVFDPITGSASSVLEVTYTHTQKTGSSAGVTIEATGLVSVN